MRRAGNGTVGSNPTLSATPCLAIFRGPRSEFRPRCAIAMPIGRSRDMKAVQAIVREFGGPDAIEFEEVELDAPGPGEVLIEQRAIGINFIDVYHRTGLYPAP